MSPTTLFTPSTCSAAAVAVSTSVGWRCTQGGDLQVVYSRVTMPDVHSQEQELVQIEAQMSRSRLRCLDPGSDVQIQDSRFQRSQIPALGCHFFVARSEILAMGFWGEKRPGSIQSRWFEV